MKQWTALTIICCALVLALLAGVAPAWAQADDRASGAEGSLDGAAGLAVTKTADTEWVYPGSEVTFHVRVTNMTRSERGVEVRDTLPEALIFERVSNPEIFYDAARRALVYIGFLEPFASMDYAFTARVEPCLGCYGTLYSEVRAEITDGIQGTEDKSPVAAGAGVTFYPPGGIWGSKLNLVVAALDNDLGPRLIEMFQKMELAAVVDSRTVVLLDGPGDSDAFYYEVQSDGNATEKCPAAENPTCGGRYVLGRGMGQWGEAASTGDSLYTFVKGMIDTYSPHAVTLSLVGHGNGWSMTKSVSRPGALGKFHDGKPNEFLIDDFPPSWLGTQEMGEALRHVRRDTGRRISLLYLDACLMGAAEVAFEVRDSVDYVLASQSWSWTSFRYDLHLADLSVSSAAQLGWVWMANEAQELQGDGGGPAYPFAFTVLDTRRLEGLFGKENALADALIASLEEAPTLERESENRSLIRAAFLASACFDSDRDRKLAPEDPDDAYCDLRSFAVQLQRLFTMPDDSHPDPQRARVAAAAAAVEQYISGEMDAMVLQNNACLPEYPESCWAWPALGGVSRYMPLGTDDWQRAFYSAEQLQAAGSWAEFLQAYWMGGPPPPPCPACKSTKFFLPYLAR